MPANLKLHVRPVRESDAAALAALLSTIIATGTQTSIEAPLSMAEQAAYIRGFSPDGVFNVAEESTSGAIAGMQSIEPLQPGTASLSHVGDISSFIDERMRGQGVGALLTRATLADAARLGYTKVLAHIRADNAGAIAFYQRMGFRVIGVLEQHVRYRGRLIDQLLAERLLDDEPAA